MLTQPVAPDCASSPRHHRLASAVPLRHPDLLPPPFQVWSRPRHSEARHLSRDARMALRFSPEPRQISHTTVAIQYFPTGRTLCETPSIERLTDLSTDQMRFPHVSPATAGSTVIQDIVIPSYTRTHPARMSRLSDENTAPLRLPASTCRNCSYRPSPLSPRVWWRPLLGASPLSNLLRLAPMLLH